MRHYENLVIVKPTLTQEEMQTTINLVESIITSNGGEIAARDDMGVRKLAYPIQRSERAYYYVVYYTIDPKAISEIERRFRINEDLLRFVTIKYEKKREVTAWHQLVAKANKAPEAPKEEPVAEVAQETTQTEE